MGLCCVLGLLALAIAIWAIVMTYKNVEQIEFINIAIFGNKQPQRKKISRNSREPSEIRQNNYQ
jgi:hypothetical protein